MSDRVAAGPERRARPLLAEAGAETAAAAAAVLGPESSLGQVELLVQGWRCLVCPVVEFWRGTRHGPVACLCCQLP